MKINYIIILFVTAFLFNSCDEINRPYLQDGSDFVADTTKRKVLLEEFTGHKCTNCPPAARIAKQLKEIYGDQLILMSIHEGILAFPSAEPFTYNFVVPEGSEIDDYYEAASGVGTPTGIVNRTMYKNLYNVNPSEWSQAIDAQLELTAPVMIDLQAGYNEQEREINLNAELTFMLDSDNLSYAAYILEDGIVKPQKDREAPVENVLDYVHNDVLRGSFRGTWGEEIPDMPADKDEIREISWDYLVPEDSDWVLENVKFVAIVFDTDTREIVQVELVKLFE